MADMCYYGNVMTATRWRMCYYGNVMTTRWRICVTMATLFYIFNSTVIDWTCWIIFFFGYSKNSRPMIFHELPHSQLQFHLIEELRALHGNFRDTNWLFAFPMNIKIGPSEKNSAFLIKKYVGCFFVKPSAVSGCCFPSRSAFLKLFFKWGPLSLVRMFYGPPYSWDYQTH